MTQDDWKALRDGDYSRFSDNEKLVLKLTEKLTRTPTNDASHEADALKGKFPDEQIVDIICTIALANLTNRMTDGLGLELEMAAQAIGD